MFSVLFRNVWIIRNYAKKTVSRVTFDTNSASKTCQTKRVWHFACFWKEIGETNGGIRARALPVSLEANNVPNRSVSLIFATGVKGNFASML